MPLKTSRVVSSLRLAVKLRLGSKRPELLVTCWRAICGVSLHLDGKSFREGHLDGLGEIDVEHGRAHWLWARRRRGGKLARSARRRTGRAEDFKTTNEPRDELR
jgi:hypothetical protein